MIIKPRYPSKFLYLSFSLRHLLLTTAKLMDASDDSLPFGHCVRWTENLLPKAIILSLIDLLHNNSKKKRAFYFSRRKMGIIFALELIFMLWLTPQTSEWVGLSLVAKKRPNFQNVCVAYEWRKIIKKLFLYQGSVI